MKSARLIIILQHVRQMSISCERVLEVTLQKRGKKKNKLTPFNDMIDMLMSKSCKRVLV
jgi:hypothetical protein